MTAKITLRGVVSGIRRHPGRAAAICAPLLAVSVFAGTTAASAHPEPKLALSLAQLNAAPAQDINTNFASGLGGQVVHVGKNATKFKATAGDDGCDHHYSNGNATLCVPWVIPAPSGQACAWLLSNGYPALTVYGRDRQHLDTNHDGIACDAGDAGVK
jgi:hypothetical protein